MAVDESQTCAVQLAMLYTSNNEELLDKIEQLILAEVC